MTDTGPPALYFHTDAVEGDGRDLVGRRAAGSSFVKGWLAHAGGEKLHVVTDTPAGLAAFEEVARGLGDDRPIDGLALRAGGDLARFGTIFFPTPGFQNAAWLRLRSGAATTSLVGITHTVSTRRIMEGLHGLIAEPVEPWDALICTSHAVKSVVSTQLEAERRYYSDRFDAAQVPMPRLPVIPLGIDTADFAPREGARDRMRKALGAPDDAIVVMTLGRLSVIEKANPLPLLIALEQVAERVGRPIHLWMAGWTNREKEEALHHEALTAICARVTARIVDGRDPELRRDIWAGADIFTLPVDSIQETFGLAPVEAMAAGLPAVMPDWDGFRDTVADGRTGILVPTRMMPPGTGQVLAERFADGRDGYLQYLALVQAQVAIDIPAYADALARLASNDDLRAQMGDAARQHARRRFDWRVVIPQYLNLADELANLRRIARPAPLRNPTEIDPFQLYRAYPSGTPSPTDIVSLSAPLADGVIDLHDRLSARQLYRRHPMPAADLERAAAILSDGPKSIEALAAALQAPVHRAMVIVLMLAKTDIVRFADVGD